MGKFVNFIGSLMIVTGLTILAPIFMLSFFSLVGIFIVILILFCLCFEWESVKDGYYNGLNKGNPNG